MKQFITIIVLIIILGGGYFLFFADNNNQDGAMEDTTQGEAMENGDNMNNTGDNDTTGSDNSGEGDNMTMEEVTVTYTDEGFQPETVTISPGTTVVFTNESGNDMWVGSDVHPTHTEYHGTSRSDHCPDTEGVAFDQCTTSSTYSFTFDQVGEWGYHNHRRAQDTGTVIVQ